jgi:activating signal cointegrator 1
MERDPALYRYPHIQPDEKIGGNLKALTLYQPWAALVATGSKRIETRSWKTNYNGPLAIHVSKRTPKEFWHLYFDEPFLTDLEGYLVHHEKGNYQVLDDKFYLGCVIAICNLMVCIPTELGAPLAKNEINYGDYSPGRYMWILSDIRKLPDPIPAKGSMRLWNWEEPEILRQTVIEMGRNWCGPVYTG